MATDAPLESVIKSTLRRSFCQPCRSPCCGAEPLRTRGHPHDENVAATLGLSHPREQWNDRRIDLGPAQLADPLLEPLPRHADDSPIVLDAEQNCAAREVEERHQRLGQVKVRNLVALELDERVLAATDQLQNFGLVHRFPASRPSNGKAARTLRSLATPNAAAERITRSRRPLSSSSIRASPNQEPCAADHEVAELVEGPQPFDIESQDHPPMIPSPLSGSSLEGLTPLLQAHLSWDKALRRSTYTPVLRSPSRATGLCLIATGAASHQDTKSPSKLPVGAVSPEDPLSLDALRAEAAAFAESLNELPIAELFGTTDGKALGTWVESKFDEFLARRYTFDSGSAARGIDFPDLNVDLKATFVSQPQSSCPFRDASQKVFGLGYHLLVFVYEKTDISQTNVAHIDVHHVLHRTRSNRRLPDDRRNPRHSRARREPGRSRCVHRRTQSST